MDKYKTFSKKIGLAKEEASVPERFKGITMDSIFSTPWKKDIEDYVTKYGQPGTPRGYGLYIHGPNKTGKTMASYAMLNALRSNQWPVAYVKSSDIAEAARVVNGPMPFRNNDHDTDDETDPSNIWTEADMFLDDLKHYKGILFIDDIGAEKQTEAVIGRYYEIIDSRYEDDVPTIYTSNWSLKELETFLYPRVCSRIDRTCKIVSTKTG